MIVHLARGAVFVGRLDCVRDPRMMRVDRRVEVPPKPAPGEARLQSGEDRLRGDSKQGVAAALDEGCVEVPVVDELGVCVERGLSGGIVPRRSSTSSSFRLRAASLAAGTSSSTRTSISSSSVRSRAAVRSAMFELRDSEMWLTEGIVT